MERTVHYLIQLNGLRLLAEQKTRKTNRPSHGHNQLLSLDSWENWDPGRRSGFSGSQGQLEVEPGAGGCHHLYFLALQGWEFTCLPGPRASFPNRSEGDSCPIKSFSFQWHRPPSGDSSQVPSASLSVYLLSSLKGMDFSSPEEPLLNPNTQEAGRGVSTQLSKWREMERDSWNPEKHIHLDEIRMRPRQTSSDLLHPSLQISFWCLLWEGVVFRIPSASYFLMCVPSF